VTGSRIVVMGVAGAGKTTIGERLASALGTAFVDADDLHPRSNVERMSRGLPLDDSMRWPWLASVRAAMRAQERVVVACSALRRSYREALRSADGVVFVFLDSGPVVTEQRLSHREDHFMGPSMLESQYDDLEPPGPDETDVASIDAARDPGEVVSAALSALRDLKPGTATAPALAVHSGPKRSPQPPLLDLLAPVVDAKLASTGARSVLLVPPDHTRAQSGAGEITAVLYRHLLERGCTARVMPATGGHRPMSAAEVVSMFSGEVPAEHTDAHDWRGPLETLGEVSADEVEAVSGGRLAIAIPVDASRSLLSGWDLIVSIGQVVPHEVVGMANFTKNLVVGLGGPRTIGATHWLAALCGIEDVLGRTHTPVRDVIDAAFDRFLSERIDVLWILTVMQATAEGAILRGLFGGTGGAADSGGAAFREAARLSASCNVTTLPSRLPRVVCWMDPREFSSTWLANKAVYRTRGALAPGAELVVLAPGVSRFGEDPLSDTLIRAHGYRGTDATVEAVRSDPRLRDDLGAAAHLVHGSSDARFRIVYCTDPSQGGLTREEIESVGYEWRPLGEEQAHLGITPPEESGERVDREGDTFYYVNDPAMGLWRV
jgi:carbohydrate kinase (thermoresistant glucokinase family)